jgi:hypothetical protein
MERQLTKNNSSAANFLPVKRVAAAVVCWLLTQNLTKSDLPAILLHVCEAEKNMRPWSIA